VREPPRADSDFSFCNCNRSQSHDFSPIDPLEVATTGHPAHDA